MAAPADTAARIHPTAVIHDGARVPASCLVGPYCIIGDGVELGDDCELMAHVVLGGPAKFGARNRAFPFASLGLAPQDMKYAGEPTRLEVGDDNVFREFVTVHRGTAGGGGVTRIGSHSLFMAYAHVAHDCTVGDHVIMANAATLAGHVTIEEWATVGAFSPVHQYCRVGAHAFIGGGTIVTRDVLPFSKTSASRENRAYGANALGLERRGFSPERIKQLQHAFRVLLQSKLNTSQAVAKLRAEGDLGADVAALLDFIESSERGIIK
jgi:UDP-N-acetylglucosamine acyltransferase